MVFVEKSLQCLSFKLKIIMYIGIINDKNEKIIIKIHLVSLGLFIYLVIL